MKKNPVPQNLTKTEAAIKATYSQPGKTRRAGQTTKNKRGSGSVRPDVPRKKDKPKLELKDREDGKIGVPGAGKR